MMEAQVLWQQIARQIAHMLNTKQKTLDEFEQMGLQGAVRFIDQHEGTTLVRPLESGAVINFFLMGQFNDWINISRRSLRSDRGVREAHQKLQDHKFSHKTTSSADTKPNPTVCDINTLRPINISELCVGVNTGTVLEGTLIEKPFCIVGIQSVMQDAKGRCATLSLYNCLSKPELANWRFRVGVRVRIKEPYYKFTMGGLLAIRVDFPSDVVIIDDAIDIQNAEACKNRGNQFFGKELYSEAVSAYTDGLRATVTSDLLRGQILCNRALCYLTMNNSSSARNDCKEMLNIPGLPAELVKKGRYRLGLALVGLGQYAEAKEALEGWPQDLAKARIKEMQSTQGACYNWISLCRKKLNRDTSPEDCASFCSPQIEIAWIKGKGRGMVAKTDLPLGTLVVVGKAVGMAQSDMEQGFDVVGRKINVLSHAALRSQLIQTVMTNPSLLASLYALSDGKMPSALPLIVNGNPVLPESEGEVPDWDRIENITTTNAFTCCNGSGSALYLLPSLFNHSPEYNCVSFQAGDLMVIRAGRDIAKGEELTISYSIGNEEETSSRIVEKHGATKEEEELAKREDPDNELKRKIVELDTRCNGGRSNRLLCAKILSSGRLHPHPSLGIYYFRLGHQCLSAGKPGDEWFDLAKKAAEKRSLLSDESISLCYELGDVKEAERRCHLLYGPKTWPEVQSHFDSVAVHGLQP